MKRFITILFAAVLLFAGCEEEPIMPGGSGSKGDVIEVTPSELVFEKASGTQMLRVKSPKSWTLTQTEDTDWCTPGITSGSGVSNFKVTVNKNLGFSRTTVLTFTAEGLDPVSVTVTQKGADSVEEDVVPVPESGITVEPQKPNADQPCTIIFKPENGNPLYNYSGELYGHFGVIVDGDWKFVPTEWESTDEKVHFKKIGDNHWEFKMEPSIRDYFQSGETPVVKIALIVRTADGQKSHDDDQFCSVQDDKYVYVPFQPDDVQYEALPAGVSHGINYNADGTVTLVLYDLDKNGGSYDYCYVIGDFNDWTRVSEGAMKRDKAAGCWWITLSDLDPDKEYRFQYQITKDAQDVRLSDPYTEVVYDQWNDSYLEGVPEFPEGAKALVSAFQINRPSYNWQHKDFRVEDKNDLVIYELLFRDFSTTQNIAGAMAELDYIENLGVNAVQLMPIQEFDGNLSWGYNPNHWFALDKQYGSREQYKEFIDECHSRGLAVIVDVVYNHATGSHTWAKMWWDGDATAENNQWFNRAATHPYNVYHDMNHENEMVKEHVRKSLAYLLEEYDVDGFRFDLTKGFTQKKTDPDVTAWGRYDPSRIDILKGYADHIWSVNSDAVVIFEHLSDWDEEEVLARHGIQLWRNVNGAYRTAVGGGTGDFSNMYSNAPFGGFVGYMESHDEERICYGATSDASTVTWGVIGLKDNWDDDKIMTKDGMFFSVKNVTVAANDRFKIRKAGEWNDAFNYGAASENFKLTVGQGYKMTNGSSSKDMYVPAAGTYDIYFSLDVETVWLMKPGERPANPAVTPTQGETALTVAMRRAGAAAAFFLTVPGPKMIWQFGELGYDYSINYPSGTDDSRTDQKPVVTDEYMAQPERKALYDTYATLLKFRRENPRFFDADADFRWTPSANTSTKTITCTVDGKSFHVVGNFSKGTVSYSVPSGSWTDYINGGSVAGNISLKEGEFRLLVNF